MELVMERHPIFEALQSSRLADVHSMLTQDPTVAAVRDEKSNSVAMIAAMLGHIDVLMHLKGLSDALLSGANKYGMNSAHYAALYNQSAALSLLWHSCPALFYEKNFWGNTPPEEAKRYGSEETRRILSALVTVLPPSRGRSQIPLTLPMRFASNRALGIYSVQKQLC